MASIVKATLRVTTAYSAAPDTSSSTLDLASSGRITLWDIRPWLPWSSRGLLGSLSWQDYLLRTAVMDSTQAPGYSPSTQGPKSWTQQNNTVAVVDTTTGPGGTHPYAACAVYGPGPTWTYQTVPSDNAAAFDYSTLPNFLNTLVLSIYANNSYPPSLGGPTATDTLSFYGAYCDVQLSSGVTTRFYPSTTIVIAPGPGVGTPTGVVTPENAIDTDLSGTAAIVQETNGSNAGSSALWHPAVLLLTNWSWGTANCNNPPKGSTNVAYTHTFTTTGGTAPFTWTITAGSLPPGLTLNASTGVVSGTPTTAGTYTFTITATDASGISSSVSCSITIRGGDIWLDLWVWRELFRFTGTDQEIQFPPGYEEALRLQLAVDIAREYPGHDLTQIKAKLAQAVARIDAENVTNSQAIEELPAPPEEQQ